MSISDIKWEQDLDGEYNSHIANHRGHRLEVFSDRSGTAWGYRIDDGESQFGYSSMRSAQRLAVEDANDLGERD